MTRDRVLFCYIRSFFGPKLDSVSLLVFGYYLKGLGFREISDQEQSGNPNMDTKDCFTHSLPQVTTKCFNERGSLLHSFFWFALGVCAPFGFK